MGTAKSFEHVPPKPAWSIDSLGANSPQLTLFWCCCCWLTTVSGKWVGMRQSENFHAFVTCKCWTGFWPCIALAWREDLRSVTLFFFSFSIGIQICLWVALAPGYEMPLMPLGSPGWGLCPWTSSSKRPVLERRAGIPISIGTSHYLSEESICLSCSGVGRSSI